MIFSALSAELEAIDAQGLRRWRRALESPQGARVMVDGCECVAFCSNDYLGLAADPSLAQAAHDGCARYGVGAGASHLILGHSAAHQALETALARFVEKPRALLFSSGYLANIGAVTALVGREDVVFADRLNHASLNDACLLSRAAFRRYPHGDTAALDRMLAATRARRRLVVSDAVFSMDGDIAPLASLIDLCERHDAWLLLDDAHGFGVLGRRGRGTPSHLDIASSRIVYMATLGKAAGVFGAFVAAAPEVVETLVQRARSYIYTTAIPSLLAHAVLRSLELIESDEWRRERLSQLMHALKSGLAGSRWSLMPSDTPIQPLLVGGNQEALEISRQLEQHGVLVPAIRPPTVPRDTARLRISLSAAHGVQDVERLVAALNEMQ